MSEPSRCTLKRGVSVTTLWRYVVSARVAGRVMLDALCSFFLQMLIEMMSVGNFFDYRFLALFGE